MLFRSSSVYRLLIYFDSTFQFSIFSRAVFQPVFQMTINEILYLSKHRPWKLPAEKWKYYQEWNKAIFLHWQVELNELRKFVPEDLEIDLFEGQAWVSVVAFTMEKIRPRNFPAFSPISNFDEINIRTYVRYNNKTGVYFLSIEGGRRISCQVAKILSELPYRHSKIKRHKNYYSSINGDNKDRLKLGYDIGPPLANKTQLDRWLTERYALFQDTATSINEFEIHHIEWPIFEINLQEIDIIYPAFNSLLSKQPNSTHYSTGVQVISWDKKKTRKSSSTGYKQK
jgi:uncharacterized protein YqjF (DUF2071 family)